jgi:hypothetical protein
MAMHAAQRDALSAIRQAKCDALLRKVCQAKHAIGILQ